MFDGRINDLDINRIDFEWVARTDDIKQLKKALKILIEDGMRLLYWII